MNIDVNALGDFPELNVRGAGIGQSGFSNPKYNPRQQGVFALNPLATPKYARNQGLRDAEFRDTLSRIYVSLADADPSTQSAYLASLPDEARVLAQVLLGNNNHGASGYIDFILSQAIEPVQEVVQVEKVVGDDYVAFFFGQAPPTFQYSGWLINSLQDDQRVGFMTAYQNILRGTQLARRGALARLRYDSVIVSGTMTAHQQTLLAENEMAVPFSFSFLVKEYVIVPSPNFQRTSVDDYVAIATDAAVSNLGPIGSASDVRVRSTMVTPPNLAAQSAAGQDEPGVVDQGLTAAQQLMSRVGDVVSSVASGNIRGAIDGTPTTPPPASAQFDGAQPLPASTLPNGHAIAIRNGVRIDAVTGEPIP